MSLASKILYIFDQGDWQSRMPVAIAAKEAGHDVVIALIGSADITNPPKGFETVHIKSPAGQMNARALPGMVKQLRRLILEQQPSMVHAVTLKYSFFTGLAALPFKGLHKIYTLAGLGYLFRSSDAKARIMRAMLAPLLKHVLKAEGATLIFQNSDDLALMIELGYADQARSILIRGSGVPLDKFNAAPEPESEAPLVLMPTRLVHEKGVHIFVEAARLIKAAGIPARFQIAGGETKHNPKAISREEMLRLTSDGTVEWLGRVEDIPALLEQSALIVYPSYYGEGIPRVLLEACAAGRAIITTDHPGCREAVDDGENGLLVPIKDVKATAEAMKEILRDRAKRAAMGEKSRIKAQDEFAIEHVVRDTIAVYGRAIKS